MSGPRGEELADLRERIAHLDRRIIEQLAERVDVARRIGHLKRGAGDATLDPGREAAVIRSAVATGREHGLEDEHVRALFWVLVEMCRAAQLADR